MENSSARRAPRSLADTREWRGRKATANRVNLIQLAGDGKAINAGKRSDAVDKEKMPCAFLGHAARKKMRRNAGTSSLRRALASGLPRKHPEEARDCAFFTPPFSDTLVNTASSSDSLSHSRIPLHASNSSASPSLRITGLCYSRATLSLSLSASPIRPLCHSAP
ncbi:hypothetical protein TGME49_259100 [Toxoplasma gondii ME49]|uniref:Uncharacterized protein n=4 Tax=Toxoplasma gondii TaxID=5811 RepID=B6KBE0_TOXGV|nr:hypothetical protein TGME49_259100 [Toxoplasma gondii ME49]ESS32264.1 hypothetical protein TGVEG_259100 [Toxoplasma gondii VEG]KYF41659.1 hypothetical protein TGARI_259100 [Toxoplasma gondii ARI]PIM05165.1 hypothetical protein TGCOUG_259100 [Toxoplasma gondii COUG]EPT29410.1 hypothetical protein TGME49_259100 [Toxoplasma gondii ME49]CEL74417.1 TPA: hypothetical protein BN1205_075340 [Toxoplasma gondii VEG]|eukprot:XP_002365124.1 hypothetical protein TGME49_259100 [Toxoplasma gondii ME49]